MPTTTGGANAIRDGLESGERLLGVRAKTHAPALIEVYGRPGVDFVWLDFEHGGASLHQIHRNHMSSMNT